MKIVDPERERRFQVGVGAFAVGSFVVGAIVAIILGRFWPEGEWHYFAISLLILALIALVGLVNASRSE